MQAQQINNTGFLQKPDKNVIQALYNLEENKDFRVILDWMLSSSGDADSALRTVESETTLHRAQGASSVLMAFVCHATNPGELLATLKRHEAGIVLPGESSMAVPSIDIE